MKTFLTNLLNFFTNLWLLAASCILAIIFGIIANNTGWSWAFWAMIVGFAYPIIYTFINIIYGWIINPITQYLASKKNKQ